ncbi:hypothetical protein [Chryseobacterium sp.]|uniref:hypothetical protein n=1 Tax=Chryseobacterium sp. TaxID=1871047 RepID=UPI002897D667|nr:hypothetical protein [Chryseobacterium sp.]
MNDGIIPPNIKFSQLAAKTGYGSQQSGAIIYVTDGGGTLAGTNSNPAVRLVAQPGIYAFDGTVWQSMASKAGNVIFTAKVGTGNGGILAGTINSNTFTTIPLTEGTNIGGGTWANNLYEIPVTGTYIIKSSIRRQDSNTPTVVQLYQYVGLSNEQDVADGAWVQIPNSFRYTMLYTRFAKFTKGDKIRLCAYSDGGNMPYSDASINIVLVSSN